MQKQQAEQKQQAAQQPKRKRDEEEEQEVRNTLIFDFLVTHALVASEEIEIRREAVSQRVALAALFTGQYIHEQQFELDDGGVEQHECGQFDRAAIESGSERDS